MIILGAHIKEILDESGHTVAWLAGRLSCDRSTLYRLFEKNSADTRFLMKISIALEHDFFAELSDELRGFRQPLNSLACGKQLQ